MITDIAKEDNADFVLIEIGGQVGDYENVLFLEAARQMKTDFPVMYILVGYLPIPKHLGEMKTKPIQHAINALGQHNILPDLVVCRAEKIVDDVRRTKIAQSCGIKRSCVISNPDVDNIYKIPLILDDQNVCQNILESFGLKYNKHCEGLKNWRAFIQNINKNTKVKVGIIGKYFDIGDFNLVDSYISVIEAVKHAAWNNNCFAEIIWIDSKKYEDDPKSIKELDNMDCIIVPGGFGKSGIEGKISTAKYCRENNIPYLGLCLGLQISVIEFARNVCNLKNANSEEFNPETAHPVVAIINEQKKILKEKGYGATMRLGGWPAILKKGTKIYHLYSKQEQISERHRHRYEINPKYIETLEKYGFVFSGQNPEANIMEFGENPNCDYFVGTQAHPEFKSRPMKPAPLFDGLIKAALNKTQKKLS